MRTCDAFNIPLDHVRRRPRLHPRHQPGARRDHPPRREAALRVLRVDRAAHPGDHPQGLRRRVRGHGLQVDRLRHRLRLADGRDRGDELARRRQHPAAPRARGVRRPGGAQGAVGRGVLGAVREPVQRGRARLRRRRHRPARHAAAAHRRARRCCARRRSACRRASTGTCRCEPGRRRCCASIDAGASPEEVAAIVAAVTAALGSGRSRAGDATPTRPSGWITASRLRAAARAQRGGATGAGPAGWAAGSPREPCDRVEAA